VGKDRRAKRKLTPAEKNRETVIQERTDFRVRMIGTDPEEVGTQREA